MFRLQWAIIRIKTRWIQNTTAISDRLILKALLTSHIKQIHITVVVVFSLIHVVLRILGHYAASSGNFLPTFRDILLAPSSRVKNPKRSNNPFLDSWPSKIGPIDCLKTSVKIRPFFGFLTLEDRINKLSRNVGEKSVLFGISTLEDVTDRLTRNVGKKLNPFLDPRIRD
jgi:hypothetical protein